MPEGLTRQQVQRYLEELVASIRGQDCHSCECTQAYLVQLAMDAGEKVDDLIDPLKVSRDKMHPCDGCKPCPPSSLCARYFSGDDFCDSGCDDGCDGI